MTECIRRRRICAAVFLPILIFLLLFTLAGCGRIYSVGITVPAGGDGVFYSDEEISPKGKRFTVACGEGLGDTEVGLKTVEVKEENAYDEFTYLTPGLSVKLTAEKGGWFKIGVSAQNETDTDQTVYVDVKGVNVRIK